MAELARPFFLEGHEVFVSGAPASRLFQTTARIPYADQEADTAMYRAKDRPQHFSSQAERTAPRSSACHGRSLRRAMSATNSCAQTQSRLAPAIRVGTGWQHPERGLYRPPFHSAAGKTNGLIVPEGRG